MTDIATLGDRALRRLGVAIIPVADRPALTATLPQAQVATNALVELGVIASDEVPSPSDQALALDKLRAVQASLAAQSFVSWPDDAVPYAVAEEYTKMTAAQAASSFGKSVDPALYAMFEKRVRQVALVLTAPDAAQLAVQAVHDDLVARGVARWTTFDIPVQVEMPYVVLAADQLAPLFGMDTVPQDTRAAEVAIYRYVALPSSGERTAVEYF